MKENKQRILVLCVLGVFLFMGPMVLMDPAAKSSALTDFIGDTPSESPNSNPATSSTGGYHYEDGGANLGVYGYTDGTKSGSISGEPSNWGLDVGRGAWNRMGGTISIPKIGTGTQDWRLKSVDTSVYNLVDTFNGVPGGQFLANNWTSNGATLSMQNSQGTTQNLVYGSSIQAMNAIDSSYFSQGAGMGFDIGSYHEDWVTYGSAGLNPVRNSQNSPATTMSGWTACVSDCNGDHDLNDSHDGYINQNWFSDTSSATSSNDAAKRGGEYSIYGAVATSRGTTLAGTYDS